MSRDSKRNKERHVGVRLPPDIHHTLVEMSQKHQVSLSVVIRALLIRALGEVLDEDGYEREPI